MQEAFLARRPLVVSDHGGLAEAVREGVDGLRFRPGDAADLARAMRRLLDDVALRERLGSRPPPVPSLEDHAEALTALYATAVHRRRQRQGRVGVVVLDNGRPQEAAEAARSAWDEAVRPRILVVENGPGGDPVLPAGGELLRLPRNVGYAAGMNAGGGGAAAAGAGSLAAGGGAAAAVTGGGTGLGAGRSGDIRADRPPRTKVRRPSAGASGARLPVATANSARTWSGMSPGFAWIDRIPRAYNNSASSATWELRGSRCCPCQCRPVAPIFHSRVPNAARPGRAAAI